MDGEVLTFTVGESEAGLRLDTLLGTMPQMGSRSQVTKLIGAGAVSVNGVRRPKSHQLVAGDTVEVVLPQETKLEIEAEELPVSILFEDEWLLVVDKPIGMPVHPSRGHSRGTLVNALLSRGLAGGEDFRPGIVHRLDKDTSGLLVVAKSVEVHRRLTGMMRGREIDRRYLALVHGTFQVDSGTIEAPVGRDPIRRKSMAIGGVAARDAVTHFAVLERFDDFTLVEARLETGRTHQIRVHFLAIGHPVAGDPTYARRDPLGLGRQFLHSYRLTFAHPFTGETVSCESPLPPDLAVVLDRVREIHTL